MRGVAALGLSLVCALAAACRADSPRAATSSESSEVRTELTSILDSLYALADSLYFDEGAYQRAEAVFAQALQLARDRGSAREEADALTRLGLTAYRLGDYERARPVLEESLELKLEHHIDDQLVSSYNALGLLAYNENRFNDAVSRLTAAAAEAKRADDRYGYGLARGNLGIALLEIGEFTEARALLTEMHDVMEEVIALGLGPRPSSGPRNVGVALLNLGMLEVRIGKPAEGVDLLQRALDVFRRIPYATGESYALGHLGTAFLAVGDAARTFAVLDTALLRSREQGLRQDEASNLEILAEQYRAAGDHTRALELYDEAKLINEELGLTVETGTDLRGEAEIYRDLGDTDRSTSLVREALAVHRQAGARFEELFDLLLLVELLEERNQSQQSDGAMAEALELSADLDVRSTRVATALTEARLALGRESAQGALGALDRVATDLPSVGYAGEAEARLLRARALRLQGDLELAVVEGWAALAPVERVRDTFDSDLLRTSFTSDAGEVYTDLMSMLIDLGRFDEAFAVSDAARGRAVGERLALARGSEAASAEAELILRSMDRVVAQIDQVELLSEEGELLPRDFENERRLLESRLDSLRAVYESQATSHRMDGLAGSPTAERAQALADQVREALSSDQVLISYHVAESGPVRIFLVTPTEVQTFASPVEGESLASRVRLARDLISRRDDLDAGRHPVFTGLFDALLAPVLVETGLDGVRQLIVVPHGVLTYLPFAALRDPGSGRFLVEDVGLRVMPSGSLLPVLAERVPEFVGAGGSSFAPLPAELPGSVEEARAVATALRDGTAFLGAEATEAGLRQALARGAPVHVATHARMNGDNPLFTRVEMAPGTLIGSTDDGRLEVREVLGLNVRAPLVFLSGCETALGRAGATRYSPGEDLATLSGAFLRAGARNIVATLWPIADDGAAVFAARFYEHLNRESPVVALAAAQRDMIADPQYSAPYYWAAYQASGDDLFATEAQFP